jgi:small subunit ribosomal protein S5
VVAKSLGSRNPHNMVKATFAALERCASPRSVANRRGKKVSELFRRDPPQQQPPAQETASA